MSARRNSISEIISWMMHKTEKCIYPGDNTMSCCCKHPNGKIRRLGRWKCIMKPERHLWMLSTPELKEPDWGHNHSLRGNSSIFLQRQGESVLESWGGTAQRIFAYVRALTYTMHEVCLLLLKHRAKACAPVFHVNNEFLIWAPHEILISGILAHRGRYKIKSGGRD